MRELEPSYENIIKQELQIADLKRAYHALMGKEVRFAECVERDPIADYDDGELATKFLTSPEVREWREQEEQP